jgi:hypothetical protein
VRRRAMRGVIGGGAALTAAGAGSSAVVPFTPRVQAAVYGLPASQLKPGGACDTHFSQGSLKAASRAAGSAIAAVDQVLDRHARRAMCIVRPPGHHAGVHGLLDDACVACVCVCVCRIASAG